MKLARFALGDCEGLILAHRCVCSDGNLAKGTILDAVMLESLKADGIKTLICAKPDAGDIHEDVAADRLARALSPKELTFSRAATGRVNIRCDQRGIIRYDRDLIRGLNEVDEAITFALVQHNQLLEAGQMVATLKIIPFLVAEASLAKIEELLNGAVAFSFHPLRQCNVGLVQTQLAGQHHRLFSATKTVTQARLSRIGCHLVDSRICSHDRAAIADEIRLCIEAGAELVLICGGTAIMDREDEVPQSVLLVGGKIDQLGLAVDPGNLLMLGRFGDDLGGGYVIGMPGCARSPKLNGLDWVLQLVLANIRLDRRELADMAAGGLLMEIASRPMPRALVTEPKAEAKIAGILLAAGASRRMGPVNKLLVPIAGKPLIRYAAEALVAASILPAIIVIGYEADKVAAALDGLPVQLVFNPNHASGQGSSVGAGIAALDDDVSDVLIGLGDMPFLTTAVLDTLIGSHISNEGHMRSITLPVVGGRRGNPVLWGKAFFPELAALTGDQGGRQLLNDHTAAQHLVACDHPGVLRDVDTADALDAIISEAETDRV